MSRIKWAVVMVVVTFAEALALVAWAEAPNEMEAWQRAMTPTAKHAELAQQAGEWGCVVTMWQAPGAEPTTLDCVATKSMVMGGRFLREEISGQFMGRPFQGLGFTGYDNVTKQFVGIWLDNAGTGIGFYTGQQERDGSRKYTSTFHDPATGKPVATRSIGRSVDRDHHVYESYVTLPDGSEHLHMRVEYTRVGV